MVMTSQSANWLLPAEQLLHVKAACMHLLSKWRGHARCPRLPYHKVTVTTCRVQVWYASAAAASVVGISCIWQQWASLPCATTMGWLSFWPMPLGRPQMPAHACMLLLLACMYASCKCCCCLEQSKHRVGCDGGRQAGAGA